MSWNMFLSLESSTDLQRDFTTQLTAVQTFHMIMIQKHVEGDRGNQNSLYSCLPFVHQQLVQPCDEDMSCLRWTFGFSTDNRVALWELDPYSCTLQLCLNSGPASVKGCI